MNLDIFLWEFILSQNIIRILGKYCYKVLKNKKAMSDNNVLIEGQKCRHQLRHDKLPNVVIWHQPKMSQNIIDILSTIPTKLSKSILMVSTNSKKLLSLELVLAVFNKEFSVEDSIVTVKVVNFSSSQVP